MSQKYDINKKNGATMLIICGIQFLIIGILGTMVIKNRSRVMRAVIDAKIEDAVFIADSLSVTLADIYKDDNDSIDKFVNRFNYAQIEIKFKNLKKRAD